MTWMPVYLSQRVPFKVTVWCGKLADPRLGIPDSVKAFFEHQEHYPRKFFIHSGWTIDVDYWIHLGLIIVCLVKNEHRVYYIRERLDTEDETCSFFSDNLSSILEFYQDWDLNAPIIFNHVVDQISFD